MNLRED